MGSKHGEGQSFQRQRESGGWNECHENGGVGKEAGQTSHGIASLCAEGEWFYSINKNY
jgi:hypothetical protein